jgi:hypothetical protein
MSHVDNWLLLPGHQIRMDREDDSSHAVEAVNAALVAYDPGRRQVFRELDPQSWGGAKYPETPVYGLAANHLPEVVVLAAVARADWPAPEQGYLMLMRQDDEAWTIFPLARIVSSKPGAPAA